MSFACDDPIAAALARTPPLLCSAAACGSRPSSNTNALVTVQRAADATQQGPAVGEYKYDLATLELERAMSQHACASVASSGKASRRKAPKRQSAPSESPNEYYMFCSCCECRAGAFAIHVGAFACGRYRDCVLCRCLQNPTAHCGGLLAAPDLQVVASR